MVRKGPYVVARLTSEKMLSHREELQRSLQMLFDNNPCPVPRTLVDTKQCLICQLKEPEKVCQRLPGIETKYLPDQLQNVRLLNG